MNGKNKHIPRFSESVWMPIQLQWMTGKRSDCTIFHTEWSTESPETPSIDWLPFVLPY
jgi:hypothetical protein